MFEELEQDIKNLNSHIIELQALTPGAKESYDNHRYTECLKTHIPALRANLVSLHIACEYTI